MILIVAPIDINSNEGFQQRVKEIDKLFSEQSRIYISTTMKIESWGIKKIYDNCFQMVTHPDFLETNEFLLFLNESISALYCHSIFNYQTIEKLFDLHKIETPLFLDFHGVVPEETEFQGNLIQAKYFQVLEEKAVKNAFGFISVSNEMQSHFNIKYNVSKKSHFVIPTSVFSSKFISAESLDNKIQTYNLEKRFLYAGGTQKWQNCDKIIKVIGKLINTNYKFHIFTPDPGFFKTKIIENSSVDIKSAKHDEVLRMLEKVHFSFILRDDHILNQVSSPTKLTEALASGTLPIFLSINVGDSRTLDLNFLTYNDLVANNLPSQLHFQEMVTGNLQKWRGVVDGAKAESRKLLSEISNAEMKVENESFKEYLATQINQFKNTFIKNEIKCLFSFKLKRIYRVIRYFFVISCVKHETID